MEQVQILPNKSTNREASVKHMGWGFVREEIFRGLKTVVVVRLHIHHRGDCCVCPAEGCAGVSGLQSRLMWFGQDVKKKIL